MHKKNGVKIMKNKTNKSDRCALFAPNRSRNIYDDYVEDILLPAEKKKFEKHLETCRICSRQVIEALCLDDQIKRLPIFSEVGQKRSLKRKLQCLDKILGRDVVPKEYVALAASPRRRPDIQGVAYGVAVDRETGQGALLECIAIISDDSVELKSKLEIRAKEELRALKRGDVEEEITTPTSYLESIFSDMFAALPLLKPFRLWERTIRVAINYKAGSCYIYESDSVALAILIAILSAVSGKSIDSDVLFSAGIKLNGYLEGVGDLEQKIRIAKEQRMKACFIADENRPDCAGKTIKKFGVTLHYFNTLEDVLNRLGLIEKKSAKKSVRSKKGAASRIKKK
jgi:hypothetical protein